MRYLVCYDASPVSKDVVALAQKFAQGWGGSVDVVSSLKRDEPIAHARLKKFEDKLEYDVKQMFKDLNVQYSCHIMVDHLEEGEQILKYAEIKKVDFIFVGIKRFSKVGKLLFGSTAQYIILNASCPVVTVHGSSG